MKPKKLSSKGFQHLFNESSIRFRVKNNRSQIISDHYKKSKLVYRLDQNSWEKARSKLSFISLTGVEQFKFQLITFLSLFFGPLTAYLVFL